MVVIHGFVLFVLKFMISYKVIVLQHYYKSHIEIYNINAHILTHNLNGLKLVMIETFPLNIPA